MVSNQTGITRETTGRNYGRIYANDTYLIRRTKCRAPQRQETDLTMTKNSSRKNHPVFQRAVRAKNGLA